MAKLLALLSLLVLPLAAVAAAQGIVPVYDTQNSTTIYVPSIDAVDLVGNPNNNGRYIYAKVAAPSEALSPPVTIQYNNTGTSALSAVGNLGAVTNGYGFIESDVTYSPSVSPTGVFFSLYGNALFKGTAAPSGTGHFGGALGYSTLNAPAVTVPLMIGTEGRVDVTAGTCTFCNSSENQLGANTGTISTWIGSDNHISSNAGTIGLAFGSFFNETNSGTITESIGFGVGAPSNTGTISTLVGYFFPDMSGSSGIGVKYSILEQDAAATLYHLGPVQLGSGVKLAPMTIANLPTCNGGATGTVAYASDTTFLNAVAFHAVVAGGGAITANTLVSCNGTNWVYN